MSTHDQRSEDLPRLTLAERKTPTSGDDRTQAEWSRATSPATAPTESAGEGNPSSERTDPRDEEIDSRSADAMESTRSVAENQSQASLFADDELAELRARWNTVQAGFVDDPRDCVHQADGLVSDVVGQLTASFTDARSRLEDQWGRGEEASTEDLRVALTRYRDFFERLLAV